MTQITVIRKILLPHLNWHGARVTFRALFLVTLMRVRTVNFADGRIAHNCSLLGISHRGVTASNATHQN
jgi:hypothetical protein